MGWMDVYDENGNVIGITGDEPWDIMGHAIEKIILLYQDEFGRKPNELELEQIFLFVTSSYFEELNENRNDE